MRSNKESSARSSAEIGKRIAGEMRQQFNWSRGKEQAQYLTSKRLLDAVTRLRAALYEAVDGFNRQAPRSYQLALLNRGDRMIFNSLGRFTLTVMFDEDQVVIHPPPEDVAACAPMRLQILRSDSGFRFRAAQGSSLPSTFVSGPAGDPSVLTELQFVDSVIRLACTSPIAGSVAC